MAATQTWTAVRHECAAARRGRSAIASAMPTGKLVSMTPIPVEISRPVNQSATILVSATFKRTPPTPITTRPTAARAKPGLWAVTNPPTIISARPALAMCRLPKR